jgi:hypothetical protein
VTRTDSTRDQIVGRSSPGRLEVSTNTVSGGGSSSSLRKAFAASGLEACGTILSASPMTNTLPLDIAGRRDARDRISSTTGR